MNWILDFWDSWILGLWLPNILPKTCPKISGKVRGKKIGSPYYIPNPNDKLSFVNKRWETNLIIFSNINLLKKDANLHSLIYFSFWFAFAKTSQHKLERAKQENRYFEHPDPERITVSASHLVKDGK